jgi:hypothetical protein
MIPGGVTIDHRPRGRTEGAGDLRFDPWDRDRRIWPWLPDSGLSAKRADDGLGCAGRLCGAPTDGYGSGRCTAARSASVKIPENGSTPSLGAELAAGRDRWPSPTIHLVPAVYDQSPIERLRPIYEQLRDQHEDQEGGDDQA